MCAVKLETTLFQKTCGSHCTDIPFLLFFSRSGQPFSNNPSRPGVMGRVTRQLTETTQERRKIEYERTTKRGLSQLGEKGDAMVLYPGTHGGHPVVVSPQKRRADFGGDVTSGIGAQILRLGR